MHIKSLPRTEAERVEARIRAEKGAIFLFQLSHAIRSRSFKTWFGSTESIWNFGTPRLFLRLQRDLIFQVNQLVRSRETDQAFQVCLSLAADLEKAALRIELAEKLKIRKADKRFRMESGTDFATALLSVFPDFTLDAFLIEGDFYLRNSISSLRIYAMARITLAEKTGNHDFDSLIASFTEEYLVDGYPHDVLSHDAGAIREGKRVTHVLIRQEYCSTWLVLEGEDIPAQTGFKIIPINKSLRRAA